MEFQYCDGGRTFAGYKGLTGDCAVRTVAITTGKSYQEVYDGINRIAKAEKPRKNQSRSNSRTGVYRKTLNVYLESIGWEWVPTMKIGIGCKVHLCKEELPSEAVVVRVSKHFTSVIDGVLHDTYDCSREGTRCVYGYWKQKGYCD